MRKITDFIINKRHFILILFIILTIISAILSSKVKINYDIAEYLPDTSQTRIGMDIMEEEFAGTETSTLNLMFENLPEEEKIPIKNDLEAIEGVDGVDYDNSEDYNKENYTLYVITIDDQSDSQKASDIYQQIKEKYQAYTIYTSGDVSESNQSVLPFWIVALAVASALVILLIMCESYVEPFLFLTSILMAVVLNKGTNLLFTNVSHITNSIAAILQMALSMDYSIMLMNRYDQEKKTEKENIKAMKNALYKAFQAISSSSVTTIVGLLALVFMSFKIGKDLGIVLAKGVLFSLICIFFVLPALILMFDKWIVKTKKKSPPIRFNILGKYSYKIRYIAVPLFLIVFTASFLLKGNLGIDYTDSKSDKISEIFTENNQIAIIYQNKDEEKISKHLAELESEDKIDEVLAYGNTINEKLTYDQLNDRLSDLGSNTNVEDYLLKIVYYDYYHQDRSNSMTFEEFINFLENEAYHNEKANKKISSNTKKDVTRLKNFVTVSAMNKKKTSSEIASILEIEKSKVNDIFIYYLSKNNNTQISLNDFIKFMNEDVLINKKYAAKIDSESKVKLNTLATYTNKQIIQKKLTSNEMAKLFGIDSNIMKELYQYYILINDMNTKMTISEFSNFVLNNVINDGNYANSLNPQIVQNLTQLQSMAGVENNKSYTYQELSQIIGMETSSVKNIYTLYVISNNSTTLTPQEFVNFVLVHQKDSALENQLTESTIKNLNLIQSVMNGVIHNKKYKSSELTSLLGMNQNNTNLLYGFYTSQYVTKNPKLSLKEFVNFLLKDVANNKEYASSLDAAKKSKLNTVNTIMKEATNHTKYTSDEIFAIIRQLSNDVEKNTVDMLYTYYGSNQQYNNKWEMTVEEFVNFLNQNILQDERFTDFIDEDMKNDIINAKIDIEDAKELLIGNQYSRVVLNTKFAPETTETFEFIQNTENKLGVELDNFYIVGNSPMAYDISQTFDNELNTITIITMIAIFIVVAITFKSFTIPIILVLMIQTAVYLTMGILSIIGENVYFISILIVQSILMGATIDYAILYTSYYLEHRKSNGIKESIMGAYHQSIHAILTSSSILIIVTLIIANFASAIAAKICKTISEGTLCSTILILTLLPAVLACCDKMIVKNKNLSN